MTIHELRDPDDARRYVLQSVWLARAAAPNKETLRRALTWSHEIASSGEPLPPIGLVADVGHIALGIDTPESSTSELAADGFEALRFDAGLLREYEDYVLGKLYADLSFERGVDAVLRYQGRDRAKALAFLITRLCDRAEIGGATFSPSVTKALLQEDPDEVLAQAWESIEDEGVLPDLTEQYRRIVAGVRRLGEVLGVEDVFELESGTALVEFGQRLALRQVLRAAAELKAMLPHQKPRLPVRPRQVATKIQEEDTYPTGGFASISTRGSIESLLHSQLLYMEKEDRPDLFDAKFLRDELFYYSRDENVFFRQRQTFFFLFWEDLVRARFKDADMPWQRIVLALGLALAAVQKLTNWLSDESLTFEFLFLDRKTEEGEKHLPLDPELALAEMLLKPQIANKIAAVDRVTPKQLVARFADHGKRSLCHGLLLSADHVDFPHETDTLSQLTLGGPVPTLTLEGETATLEGEDPMDAWGSALRQLVEDWIR